MVNKWKAATLALWSVIYFYLTFRGLLIMFVFLIDPSTIPEKSQHLIEWAISNNLPLSQLAIFLLGGFMGVFALCLYGAWYLADIAFWKNEYWKNEKNYLKGLWENWHPFGKFKNKVVNSK